MLKEMLCTARNIFDMRALLSGSNGTADKPSSPPPPPSPPIQGTAEQEEGKREDDDDATQMTVAPIQVNEHAVGRATGALGTNTSVAKLASRPLPPSLATRYANKFGRAIKTARPTAEGQSVAGLIFTDADADAMRAAAMDAVLPRISATLAAEAPRWRWALSRLPSMQIYVPRSSTPPEVYDGGQVDVFMVEQDVHFRGIIEHVERLRTSPGVLDGDGPSAHGNPGRVFARLFPAVARLMAHDAQFCAPDPGGSAGDPLAKRTRAGRRRAKGAPRPAARPGMPTAIPGINDLSHTIVTPLDPRHVDELATTMAQGTRWEAKFDPRRQTEAPPPWSGFVAWNTLAAHGFALAVLIFGPRAIHYAYVYYDGYEGEDEAEDGNEKE